MFKTTDDDSGSFMVLHVLNVQNHGWRTLNSPRSLWIHFRSIYVNGFITWPATSLPTHPETCPGIAPCHQCVHRLLHQQQGSCRTRPYFPRYGKTSPRQPSKMVKMAQMAALFSQKLTGSLQNIFEAARQQWAIQRTNFRCFSRMGPKECYLFGKNAYKWIYIFSYFLRKFYVKPNGYWTPFERLLNAFERTVFNGLPSTVFYDPGYGF